MKKPVRGGKVAQEPAASPNDISRVEGFDDAMRRIAKVSKAELERREQAEQDAKRASR